MIVSTLSHLLADYHLPDANQYNFPITGLAVDSRAVQPGQVFLAYPGFKTDGRHYIAQALEKGAAAILFEPGELPSLANTDVPFIPILGLREQIGLLAARWFDYPTRKLNLFGVTGTNGKTSCTHFIAQSLAALGESCGVLGTVGVGFPGRLKTSALTTPDALDVQKNAKEILDAGAKSLAMEVSSHALVLGRVNGVHFSNAVFTNLTQDHLDLHHTMAAYAAAKAQLFHWPSLKNAVINLDDPFGQSLYAELIEQPYLNVMGYAVNNDAYQDKKIVHAEQVTANLSGLRALIQTPWGEGWLESSLIGHFHLSNLLAVLTVLCMNGVTLNDALAVMPKLKGVPGRMQNLGGGNKPIVIVDYAHTPDALEKALRTLRAYQPNKLCCVFGCGGDRDSSKRPLMGKIAADLSDSLIVTNDNPRTESPGQIVADILTGIPIEDRVEVEYDRARAIYKAISAAKAGDIVLIAGKGHEDYQILGADRLHFSDVEEVEKVLQLNDFASS